MKVEDLKEEQLFENFELEELEERLEMTSSGWYYVSFYYFYFWY